MTEKLPPVHPGEVLRYDFLEPLEMNGRQLAEAIKVPANRITLILNGQRAVTVDTARRLGRYFGTGPEFWMGIQVQHDLDVLDDLKGAEIDAEVIPRQAATA